jgi:murein DD-endopeptidase MepM/ murein hydrolase activator NlpD
VKNKIFKTLLLGSSTVIAAGTCYALIAPVKEQQLKQTAFSAEISNPVIANPVVNDPIFAEETTPTLRDEVETIELTELTHVIKSGESLSTIFSQLDLSKVDLHDIINANTNGKEFATIRPGKSLIAKVNQDGQLEQLVYAKNAIDTLVANRTETSFDVKKISKQIDRRISSAEGTIHSSLFLDGKEAGLPDKIIMELANIFAWDIDFALSLREGDRFTVVYEKLFVDGKEVNSGNILSAEFVNQDHIFTALRFEDQKGNSSYYSPEGKSMRKAFLRTPVDFARISSRFNLKRKHPVLNRIRAHKGVDYAAKTGTPIKTTGDGKIVFRGRKGGYGRVVIVQHGQKYSTLYAHLSSFKKGQKTGSRVKQGQVIGYVGKSGLATGPHLHYEFRVNGAHRNPLTVKLPHANPIDPNLMAEFKAKTEPLLAQLNKVKANNLLAQNQP